MKLYADDPRDLSRSPTLEHFLGRYGQFIRNCAGALKPGGKLAILMGDYTDREAGFVPLAYHTKRLAFAAGLTAALHRHHPIQPRRQQQQESLPQQLHPRPARRLHDLRENQVTNHQPSKEAHHDTYTTYRSIAKCGLSTKASRRTRPKPPRLSPATNHR